jgi:hypothetical protein
VLIIWVSASPGTTAARLKKPISAPVSVQHIRHFHAARATQGTSMAATRSDHSQPESTVAPPPAIFPPDGALSDDAFAASTISLTSDDEPADLSNTGRLGRTPGQLPFPASPARASVTRDVIDNLGRLLTHMDRDLPRTVPRPRVHR